MKRTEAIHRSLLAAALAVLPAAAAAMANLLDQSTRRPSVARLLMHSLQAVS